MPRDDSPAADKAVRRLQELLLTAVLLRRPLPGVDRALVLPDLDFVLREESVVVANENLAGSLSLEGLARPVRILSPDDIREEASRRGDVAYLRFEPAERAGDAIRLTLQARMAPSDPGRGVLGLSGVQLRFREVAGEWEVAEDPVFFAA
jgi:hypothetical protein